MNPELLPNGNLLVPYSALGPGRIMGDTTIEIEPGTPEYAAWLPFVNTFPEAPDLPPPSQRVTKVGSR